MMFVILILFRFSLSVGLIVVQGDLSLATKTEVTMIKLKSKSIFYIGQFYIKLTSGCFPSFHLKVTLHRDSY